MLALVGVYEGEEDKDIFDDQPLLSLQQYDVAQVVKQLTYDIRQYLNAQEFFNLNKKRVPFDGTTRIRLQAG